MASDRTSPGGKRAGMTGGELRARWRDLGERIKADPADFEAWAAILAMGRIEYEPSTGHSAGRFMVVLDE